MPSGLARVGASLALATTTAKLLLTLAPTRSVAVTFRVKLPTSPLSGVPLKLRVPASKLSHAGKAVPSACSALYFSVSPGSVSANVPAGTVKFHAASSVADWLETGEATVGAALLLSTTTSKFPMADAPAASVAVSLRAKLPTSPLSGVPLKARVVASKLSQAGSAAPSACVAEKLSVSPTSTSVNVSMGTTKLKTVFFRIVCSSMVWASVGASFVFVTVTSKRLFTLSPVPSVACTRRFSTPTSALPGVPLKARVAASKLNHDGRGLPLACVAW